MLNRISKKIAGWCYAGTRRGDVEITAYGIELLLDTLTKLLALIIIAIFIGCLQEMLIVLIVFSSLRFFAGGFHMHTGLGCFLSMAFIFGLSFLVDKLAFFYNILIPKNVLALVLLVLIGLVFLYAPSATQNNPITDKRILRRKRLGSVVLSILLAFVIWYLPDNMKLWAFVPFICEVVTILPIVNNKTTREEG
ncbi:MAG: accessory gene regulator B family protein [Velocimicrobium sp.]